MFILVIKGRMKKVHFCFLCFFFGRGGRGKQELNRIKLELVHGRTNTEYFCAIDSSVRADETPMRQKN